MGIGVSSPGIVGRSQELNALSGALLRATGGEPSLIVAGGAAGVGKSRLVAEFSDRAVLNGARVLTGHCLELAGGGLPFGPIAAILRDLARTTSADRLVDVLGPARAELARLVPELAAIRDVSPAAVAATTDGVDIDPGRAQARLFEYLLGVFGRLGSEAPTVLILEDVQWIDPATRDLVSFLASNLRNERVLIVMTSRSEHLPRSHPHAAWLAELGRNPRSRLLNLEPFSPAETATQLGAILDAEPDADLVARIHRRSEGNPLFNEELLAAIRSGTSSLPAILSDALGAKIRALPPRTVEVLRVAAVASRSFDERFIAAILGGAEEDYLDPVRDAVVGQVLVAGPMHYNFRHGLFAEAIEADLTPGERRSLHGRIAAALDARPDLAEGGPGSVAGEAADHWRAADRPAEAYRSAVQAGLAASAMYAYRVAFERWEQALAIGERVDPAQRLEFLVAVGLDESDLLIRAAQVAALSEDHERAIELAERAITPIDAAAESARSAVLRSDYARILWAAGRFERAHEMLREAAQLVEGAGTVADRARVMGRYAAMLLWRGRLEEGVAVAREAVDSARRSGLRAVEVEALDVLGNGLWFAGSINEAIERLREARQADVDSGSVEELLFVSDSLAECLVDADRLEEAIVVASQGEADARRFGLSRTYGAMFRGNAGLAMFGLGRWREAEAMTAQEMVGHGRVWGMSVRARLLAATGNAPGARAIMASVAADFPEGLPDLGKLECALPTAELLLVEGDLEGALAAALGGLDVAWPHVGLRLGLAAVGMRAAADLVQGSRARRDGEVIARATAAAERCLAEVGEQRMILGGWDPPTPSKLATADLARAEMARLNGTPDPEQWAAIADAFGRVPMPYPAAYAYYRQAEALLVQGGIRATVGDLLRAANEACRDLGAAPLSAAIALLSRHARVELAVAASSSRASEPLTPAPSPGRATSGRTARVGPGGNDLGLSARELEVLRLVAAGRTNGQIAMALYISPKTASVHVTHILDKLGAGNRVEAAMIAARMGLLEREAAPGRHAGRDSGSRDQAKPS